MKPMKRYLLTSTKFTGEVEMLYDAEGVLRRIDMRNTSLTAQQVHALKKQVPAHDSLLAESFTDPGTVIVPAEFNVTLADFKHEYPYQRNMHLLPAIWDKMAKTEQVIAWEAAKEYRRYCKRNEGWYKPKIAAAWLKAKEYLNDWKTL
jgi:hypothetical protein